VVGLGILIVGRAGLSIRYPRCSQPVCVVSCSPCIASVYRSTCLYDSSRRIYAMFFAMCLCPLSHNCYYNSKTIAQTMTGSEASGTSGRRIKGILSHGIVSVLSCSNCFTVLA